MLFKPCNLCEGIRDSLDVRFTKACDNCCAFCIEREGLESLGSTNVDRMIQATIDSGIREVLILGGEPFLQPQKLLEYVKGIRSSVDRIYITTSLPVTFLSHRMEISEIIQLIDGLNCSIQNTYWRANNEVLHAKDRHNRIHILRNLNFTYGDKIRTCLNLIKGEVDDKKKLINALRFLIGAGSKIIKINEMQHQPDLYVSFEEIMDKALPSPYAHGCMTPVIIPGVNKNNEATILLKRSCFCVEPSRSATAADVFKSVLRLFRKPRNKFRVLYEDGTITNQWKQQSCLPKLLD